MNVTITPIRTLSGEIVAPASKAHTHRALFAGLLSEGLTELLNPLSCDDTQATVRSVTELGATLVEQPGVWSVTGNGRPKPSGQVIDCGESGVTLRFTIPIAALTGSGVTLRGGGSLMRRPLQPLVDAMRQLGIPTVVERSVVRVEGGPPQGGVVKIRGDVSSQFISGLLLAGPLMEKGLSLKLSSTLESSTYVSLTLETMKRHGITVENGADMLNFEIAPGQKYGAAEHKIPGDFSSAAFPMCAAAITGSKVLTRNLTRADSEPDSMIVEVLSRMGVETSISDGGVFIEGGNLRSAEIDIRNCPDLGPIIAVLGAYAAGKTRITGAARLRYKESDRLSAIASELNLLGAAITETSDGLVVSGQNKLTGGSVQSHGDHRIAMALSVAALGAKGRVVIGDAECVSKSYPNFFDDLRSLGVEVVER